MCHNISYRKRIRTKQAKTMRIYERPEFSYINLIYRIFVVLILIGFLQNTLTGTELELKLVLYYGLHLKEISIYVYGIFIFLTILQYTFSIISKQRKYDKTD